MPGVPTKFTGIDLVIVRENTEDLYSGLEHEVVPGVVESLKIITERASRRIAEFAFRYARERGRKKVTSVHKANIMKLGDGLFVRTRARRRAAVHRHRVRRAHRRRGVHAPGDAARDVRHARAAEPVRRHRLRPVRRARRRPGSRAGRQSRHRDGGVRGGPRQRARHRRQEPREPDGAAAVRRADAATTSGTRRGEPCAQRPRARAGRRQGPDARSRRHGEHDGVHRTPICKAIEQGAQD